MACGNEWMNERMLYLIQFFKATGLKIVQMFWKLTYWEVGFFREKWKENHALCIEYETLSNISGQSRNGNESVNVWVTALLKVICRI